MLVLLRSCHRVSPNNLICEQTLITMNKISINYTYIWCLDFAENYVFTKCKKCFNLHRNKEVKKVYNNGCLGYNVKGKFYSLTKLRDHLKKVEKSIIPF